MLDGITPATVPAGAQIYAGYVGGEWPSYAALVAAHPGALHVSIAVNASESARVLDVETGDAIPAEAPGWATRERVAGNPYPVVYMNMTTWPAVKAAFTAQGVTPPLYWVALYVTDPTRVPDIPAGALAIQYYDYGGYDESVVADYWPGLDPAPIAAAAPAPAVPEEDPVQIEPLAVHPGEYALITPPGLGTFALVADGYKLPAAGVRVAIWVGSECTVLDDVTIGGASGVHTFGHPLPAGCTGVTVRRLDAQSYPVGIGFRS